MTPTIHHEIRGNYRELSPIESEDQQQFTRSIGMQLGSTLTIATLLDAFLLQQSP
jgi:hypothetical protein